MKKEREIIENAMREQNRKINSLKNEIEDKYVNMKFLLDEIEDSSPTAPDPAKGSKIVSPFDEYDSTISLAIEDFIFPMYGAIW